jgi:hypothetical protein
VFTYLCCAALSLGWRTAIFPPLAPRGISSAVCGQERRIAGTRPLLRSRTFSSLDQKRVGWQFKGSRLPLRAAGLGKCTVSNDFDLPRPCGSALVCCSMPVPRPHKKIGSFPGFSLRITSLARKARAQNDVCASRPQNNSMRQSEYSIVLTTQ